MRRTTLSLMAVLGALALLANQADAYWPGDPPQCKPDAVKAGPVCMDKYEASVWQIPATNLAGKSNGGLIKKVQGGVVTLAQLAAGGATQISAAPSCFPAFPGTFPANGQWTAPLYAVSVAGVAPTTCATWFQAQQACFNSRKRLPSNAEWQGAGAGTQDPGPDNGATDCNTNSVGVAVKTGARSGCVSSWGAFDMVGNAAEWVADWVPASTACGGWGGFSGDLMCLSGASTTATGPGALLRGGAFDYGSLAGPLTVDGGVRPSVALDGIGFRCAR